MIGVYVKCPLCKSKKFKTPDKQDIRLAERVESEFEQRVKHYEGLIPNNAIPDGNMVRENAVYQRGIKLFRDFFTNRNLLANVILKKQAQSLNDIFICQALSDTLSWTNKMMGDAGHHGPQVKGFWVPDVFVETNVWEYFSRRFKVTIRGKMQSNEEIGDYAVEAKNFKKLDDGRSFLLLNISSHELPLPDNSVDTIITDPPYGGNVQYAEMCDFWAVWLKEVLGIHGPIDKEHEAIETRHKGFASAKDHNHYRKMLLRILKECYRVLKPGRWMVMTFHNREFKVWNSIHLAAHDAGFRLAQQDGMIYQPPISLYSTDFTFTSGRLSGSMLGDFILSFQKVEKTPEFKAIEHAEIGRQIERLAAEAVLHHKGASLSLIYMKLMPWLLNNNLLDKISEKEIVPYLSNSFEEKDGKWYLKANPGDELKHALEEYSRQHYKASYEDLNFVPVEARIEYLIKRLLYARGFATQDDILNAIYKNLINSNMAEAREIQQVLNSIAELIPISQAAAGKVSKGKEGRKVWKLKEDIEREKLFAELGADVEYRLATSEESDHDLAIARLMEMAGMRNLKAHIGRSEQMKYAEFRQMSSDLPQRVQGMPKAARDIIEQIDVLWHNGGKGIVAAFEVERTTTITSGIDRFRNLLTAAPESEVELYLVVPKSRGNEVRNKLGSPANRKDGLHKKIGYIYLEDLDIRHAVAKVEFEKIRHFINGGQ